MENLQFRTNLIEWSQETDGSAHPVNAYSLKDCSEYGSDLAKFIATDLIPDWICYAAIGSFDQYLDEYEEDFLDGDDDPVSEIAPDGLTKDEMNAARILYMKFRSVEWPTDERNLSAENLMNAYFESPDVSKMNKDDLESVFIEPVP